MATTLMRIPSGSLMKRIIKAGLRGFYRNRTVSLSSIFILTITLSIITAFYLFHAVFTYTLAQIQEKVDVRVYFTVDATAVSYTHLTLPTNREV